jgi:hypothetical protein
MGSTVFPAPSAGGKTMFRTTLTSGTSYTVPAGVTYLNVTLYGGGGGGGAATYNDGSNGTDGGTTTFTGATSAAGGNGGRKVHTGEPSTAGVAATTNSFQGGSGGFRGVSSAGGNNAWSGGQGVIISSTLSATAGSTIAYAIGAGGAGGTGTHASGGAGGSGKIDIEYWA